MLRGYLYETGVFRSRAFAFRKFFAGEGFQTGDRAGLRKQSQRRLHIGEAKSGDDLRTSGYGENQAVAVPGATSGNNRHNIAFHGHKFGRH